MSKPPTEAHMPSINRILQSRDIAATMPDHFAFRLESSGFMPLSIERIGTGPRAYPLISVMHTYTQNGDLMRDPDVEMECFWDFNRKKWRFFPTHFRQDGGLPIDHPVIEPTDGGKLIIQINRMQGVRSFCHHWSINLNHQGFVEAAEIPAFLDA